MSDATLVNPCNASTLAEQSINKPNYTPGKALKKAFKLLKRVFKSTKGSKVDNNSREGQIKATKSQITEQRHHQDVEPSALNVSTLTTCSTLSAEEYQNELNELIELTATRKLNATD